MLVLVSVCNSANLFSESGMVLISVSPAIEPSFYTPLPQTDIRRIQSYVSGRSSLRITGYDRGYAHHYRAFEIVRTGGARG